MTDCPPVTPAPSGDSDPELEALGESDLQDEELIRKEAEIFVDALQSGAEPEKAKEVVLQFLRTHSSYRGPMPSARMLAELKQVDSTFAERAMLYAEREQKHRHTMGDSQAACIKRAQWMEFCGRSIGQVLAVVIVLGVVAPVSMLIYHGKNVSPFTPIIYALAALATAVIAAKAAEKWREKKSEESTDEEVEDDDEEG